MARRVFLSYARDDLEMVRRFHTELKKRDVDVWFDKVDLKQGPWKKQIRKAITSSTDFIICLSQSALRKTGDEPGFMDEELDYAYHIATVQADAEFAIIPVRLEDCGRGDHRLSTYQQYDLFQDWDGVLDQLALHLGGHSLADREAIDEREEWEKMLQRLHSKVEALYYAGRFQEAQILLEVIADLEEEESGGVSARTVMYRDGVSVQLGRDVPDPETHQDLQISPLYISYSHADGAFVDYLEAHLNQQGIRFWRDIHNAVSGRLEPQIERAMRLNPTVLVVLSQHSVRSDWVLYEIESARKLEKELGRDVLCPVALDDSWQTCQWPSRIRQWVEQYRILDFSAWHDQDFFTAQFSRLIRGLRIFYESDT